MSVKLRIVPMRLMRRWDLILCLLFVIVWLFPVAYVGLFNKGIPVVGNYLNNMYRVACLFTHRVGSWSDYYIQVRLADVDEWRTVQERDYSAMKVFGYRSRLRRAISSSGRRRNEEERLQAIARFVRGRYEELDVGGARVEAVRFVRVVYPVGGEIAHPAGRWEAPHLEDVPSHRWWIISEHDWDTSGSVKVRMRQGRVETR